MNSKIITISALILLTTMSCSDNDEKKIETQPNNQEAVHNNHDDNNEIEDQLSLNNGEKWKVNEEMVPHIEKSQKVLENLEGDNFSELAEDMMEHTNKLIKSCAMDGPSHDELHKWLHPHIELIKKLKTEKDQQKAEEIVGEIEESFEVYHEYFQ